jgi:hypothetical protein
MWYWYLYPLPLCMAVGVVAIAESVRGQVRSALNFVANYSAALVVLVGSVAIQLGLHVAHGGNVGLPHAASAIATFSKEHPGRYAMGDRGGLTAFIVGQPFLQLEGLVADRAMLEAIRSERPLPETLAQYGIDYLVEAIPTRDAVPDRCQSFDEPKTRQAGPHSPKMRGSFCSPLLRFDETVDSYSTFVYSAHSYESPAPAGSPRRTDSP